MRPLIQIFEDAQELEHSTATREELLYATLAFAALQEFSQMAIQSLVDYPMCHPESALREDARRVRDALAADPQFWLGGKYEAPKSS